MWDHCPVGENHFVLIIITSIITTLLISVSEKDKESEALVRTAATRFCNCNRDVRVVSIIIFLNVGLWTSFCRNNEGCL